jgi:DNA (cytosine-5)-methyltransferase 1
VERANPGFRFVDLFAGIGGMRVGAERLGGKCVFTSEWNKQSRETYRANFGDEHIAGDITKLDTIDIPDHDLLMAGFPCQPFSLAGVSKKNSLGRAHGFECETQGTLFFDVARIIDEKRPASFVLENVKNLKSHDKGNTFDVITRTLRRLGYQIDHLVIDAQPWVPQHRERIFIVGFREETDFTFSSFKTPPSESGPWIRSILHPEDGTEKAEPPYTEGDQATVAPKYTLTPRLWDYLQKYAAGHKAKGNGFGYGLVDPATEQKSRTLSARYYKDGSEILIRQSRRRPRRLTPRECARLMGFDSERGSTWQIPVSDTQAYKQFGNAVAPPVVEAVVSHMLPHIRQAMTGKNSDSNRQLLLAAA